MKKYIISFLIALSLPMAMTAQKISLGTCATHDNGIYQGEMSGGKPHGKGTTLFESGNT